MSEKLIEKIGYFSIYEITGVKTTKYRIDSGKMIYLEFLNKSVENKNRIVKDFTDLDKAKLYAKNKMVKSLKAKKKKVSKLPKDLYLVLIEEKSTGKTFVKVGITSKKYIIRRFSKKFGYEGYELKEILRRIKTPKAEKLEEDIKNALNKKYGVKKYRPILENFSGYSECYDILGIDEIIRIFDYIVSKN
jgi:nitrogenase molybdenum-iron protein alpha/beta subunit